MRTYIDLMSERVTKRESFRKPHARNYKERNYKETAEHNKQITFKSIYFCENIEFRERRPKPETAAAEARERESYRETDK